MDTSEIERAVHAAIDEGRASSIVWLVSVGDEVQAGAVGHVDDDPARPTPRDTIFRLSSMTKPITAFAALQLVDDGVLALDEPIDDLLPELAHRRVLRDPHGSLGDTVPAARAITLRDLLTFRMGLGFDFSATGPQPALARLAELGLPPGPPQPQAVASTDEWLATIGQVPLEYQPGERWLYHVSADVLGALIERATGQPLGAVLRQRIFDPLGMADTGFSVPPVGRSRFGACFGATAGNGAREVFDPADGQWSREPGFPSGGGGLVSTVDDFHAFASMLRRGGTTAEGRRLLSADLLEQMTTNQLTDGQIAAGGPTPDGSAGWGFGVGIQLRTVPIRAAGSYDWDGGLGSSWANDPSNGLIGILLTDQMWVDPHPPQVCDDFWSAVYRALR